MAQAREKHESRGDEREGKRRRAESESPEDLTILSPTRTSEEKH